MPPSKAYLEIRIGDPETHKSAQDAHGRALAFITAKGAELGIEPNTRPEDMEDWQKEVVEEAYGNDPAWRDKGPILLTPPPQQPGGRLTFTLNSTTCPKTVTNFLALCTNSHGLSKSTKKPLHHKNTPVHRIISSYIAQGGDITRYDGSGGDSIYNGTFNDEKEGLKAKFDGKGILAMANSGKNSNTSQWFVTLSDDKEKLKKMDGKYVIFGKVVDGWEVLDELNKVGSDDGTPKETVMVVDCGVVE